MRRLLIGLCVTFSLGLSWIHTVGATGGGSGWQQGLPTVDVSTDHVGQAAVYAAANTCDTMMIEVASVGTGAACVSSMNGWRYGIFTYSSRSAAGMSSVTMLVISSGADQRYYAVDGMPLTLFPEGAVNSDTLVYKNPDGTISVYPHFLQFIERSGGGYKRNNKQPLELRFENAPLQVRAVAFSNNGHWMVAETNTGIVRVDLATSSVRRIASVTTNYELGYSSAMSLAVSDDGGTVFIGGRLYAHRQFWVVSVDGSCDGEESRMCISTDLTPLFEDGSLPDGWPIGLHSNSDGSRLNFYIERFSGGYARASLRPRGVATQNVRYLALGDSFSSGEGDTARDSNGQSYYLPHTDAPGTGGAPAERCHISSRSYPFILAANGGVEDVRSVACSGARIRDIVSQADYRGQGAQLDKLSDKEAVDARQSALDAFIPGRVRQSVFVDRYQPKAISLSIGGNDVQFSGIISACVHSLTTCSYASDPTDRRNLGESIKALYPQLVSLYASLARSDPGAHIYAVGYPRFVNESNLLCPLTTNLDYQERTMIDEGVRYINQVVRAAASSAGVAYLDIEDALATHRVCDNPGGYVNAIDLFGQQAYVETFHPNALGHTAMAQAMMQQTGTGDLAAAEYCADSYPCPSISDVPRLPAYFGDATVAPAFIALPSELVTLLSPLAPLTIEKGAEFLVSAGLLTPSTAVRIELHSTPLQLASAMTDAAGNVTVRLSLPASVETGYHTVHLYGVSPSGEAVDMYQIVFVADHQPAPGGDAVAGQGTVSGPTEVDADQPMNANEEMMSAKPVRTSAVVLPATLGRLWPYGAIALGALGIAAFVASRALWRRPR